MQIDQRIDALENSYYIWFLLTTEIVSVGGGGRIQKIQKGVAGTLNCSILSTSHFSMMEIYKKKLHNLKGKGVAARWVISEGRWGGGGGGAYGRKFTV